MISIDDYRNSIRRKYQEQRLREDFDFATVPTSKDIRQRAYWIMAGNPSKTDSEIIKRFFEIKDGENWRTQIDDFPLSKLKPVQSLLDGSKDSRNERLLDFGASIVELENRPFKKFRRTGISEAVPVDAYPETELSHQETNPDDGLAGNILRAVDSSGAGKAAGLESHYDKSETGNERTICEEKPLSVSKPLRIKARRIRILIMTGFATLAFIAFSAYGIRHFTNRPFMQWQTDHYVKVGQDVYETPSTPIHKLSEAELLMRKVRVCDTTTFFIKGEPKYWYIRDNGYVFFDKPGRYPLDYDKELKPVSRVIAEKVRSGEIDVDY